MPLYIAESNRSSLVVGGRTLTGTRAVYKSVLFLYRLEIPETPEQILAWPRNGKNANTPRRSRPGAEAWWICIRPSHAKWPDTGECSNGKPIEAGRRSSRTSRQANVAVSAPDPCPLDELMRPFAESIHAKAAALGRLADRLSRSERARLREAMSADIQKCTNFIKPEVSQAALEAAMARRIDLRRMHWHRQPSFDKGRRLFHWEHIVPVSALRDECCSLDSPDDVLRLLLTKLRVVWILKAENQELERLGLRSNRPDPEDAYERAGIRLLRD